MRKAMVISIILIAWMTAKVSRFILQLDIDHRDVSPTLETSGGEKISCPSIYAEGMKSVSVVIPAYNEEKRLLTTLKATTGYLEERRLADPKFTYEVTVVDDGSKDRTFQLIQENQDKFNLRVIKQEPNRGKGAAIRKGMLCSQGKLMFMADADSAPWIADMQKLEDKFNSLDDTVTAAAVFGSRCAAKRKPLRLLLSKVFHGLVVLVTGTDVKDTQCGLKLFTRPAAQKLFPNLHLQRWAFDVELVYLAKRMKIPIFEVSVNALDVAGSKIRLASCFHMLYEILTMAFAYGLGLWKLV